MTIPALIQYRDTRIEKVCELAEILASRPMNQRDGQEALTALDAEMSALTRLVEMLHSGKREYAFRDLPDPLVPIVGTNGPRTQWERAVHWLRVLRALYGTPGGQA